MSEAGDLTHDVDRRGFMRGVAATGATAAGVTATSARPAQAIAPAAAGAALLPYLTGKTAVGLAGMGVGASAAYFFTGSDIDTDAIVDASSRSEMYSVFESVMRSQRLPLEQIADDYGVDLEDEEHVEPDDNDLAHSMMEHSTGSAAQTWADGGGLSDCQAAARQALQEQYSLAYWNVMVIWNDFVAGISPALVGLYNLEGERPDEDDDLHVRHRLSNNTLSTAAIDETTHDLVVDDQLEHPDYDGTGSIIGKRDFSDILPIDPENLREEERPVDGFVVYEIGMETTSGNITSPLSPDEDYQRSNFTAEYQPADQTESINLGWFRELLDAIESIYNEIDSELEETISNLYDGLSSGQTTIGEVMSPRMVYQQYQPSSEQSLSEIYLQNLGNLSFGGPGTATMEIDGQTYYGSIYPEVSESVVVEAGEALQASDYEMAQINDRDSSEPFVVSGSDIEITDIEGADQLSFEPRTRLGRNQPRTRRALQSRRRDA